MYVTEGSAEVTVSKLTVYRSSTRVVSRFGLMMTCRIMLLKDTEVITVRSEVSGVKTECNGDSSYAMLSFGVLVLDNTCAGLMGVSSDRGELGLMSWPTSFAVRVSGRGVLSIGYGCSV